MPEDTTELTTVASTPEVPPVNFAPTKFYKVAVPVNDVNLTAV